MSLGSKLIPLLQQKKDQNMYKKSCIMQCQNIWITFCYLEQFLKPVKLFCGHIVLLYRHINWFAAVSNNPVKLPCGHNLRFGAVSDNNSNSHLLFWLLRAISNSLMVSYGHIIWFEAVSNNSVKLPCRYTVRFRAVSNNNSNSNSHKFF